MSDSINENIQKLLDTYTSLKIEEETEERVVLAGSICVHRSMEQFVINKDYEIGIYIPKQKGMLPYVVDTGESINIKYPHIYPDRKLCLATDIDMQLALSKDPSLINWMRDFVEAYFVSYAYYERYGIFPMGERPHGAAGIIQSYMEVFDVSDAKAAEIILFISYKPYRGHQPCPCGSGDRIRKCHGKKLLEFYNNPILLEQVRMDCKIIAQEVLQNELAGQYKNKRKAKY